MTSSTSAFTRLTLSLKRALGPAGADGRLATDAATAARRLAGVGAVRDPPAGAAAEPAAGPSTTTTTPAGPALTPAAAAALARDWAVLVDAVRVHQVRVRGERWERETKAQAERAASFRLLFSLTLSLSYLPSHRTSSPRTTLASSGTPGA